MSKSKSHRGASATDREAWLIDVLHYAIQFYIYAEAARDDVAAIVDSLSESDEYDDQVAALVQMPKWCSPCEAQGAVDRHFKATRETPYLVWSNEHSAWWGPEHRGYTRHIERAGRYDRAEAFKIAGTRGGGWHVRKGNPDEIALPELDAIEQYAAITAALKLEQQA